MPELEHLSYSSIALWLECPRKFRFRYLDRLPSPTTPSLAFGSAFHSTVARVLCEWYAGNTPDLPSVWSEEWTKTLESSNIEWDGELPEQVVNDGIRLFGHRETQDVLARLHPYEDQYGLFVERRIELHVPGVPVPVIGFVDLLTADGLVHDFKTASRAWTQEQAEQEAQPLYYLAALNQAGIPHRVGQFRHVVLVKTRTPQVLQLDSLHHPSEMFWLFDVIRCVWGAIERELFPPNPKACFGWGRRCEFYQQCRGRR